jgi:hypothetical protein
MPRLDFYHHAVKRALKKDQWIITDDPFSLAIGVKRLYVDLGAERLISAHKAKEQIVVEVKSFLGPSYVKDLEQALGQFVLYEKIIRQQTPDKRLYLALTNTKFNEIFSDELGQLLLTEPLPLRLMVFDEEQEEITQWIPT